MSDRFPRKFDVQLRSRANICCEHQISSGNLSHDNITRLSYILFYFVPIDLFKFEIPNNCIIYLTISNCFTTYCNDFPYFH